MTTLTREPKRGSSIIDPMINH